mmetsp:Transcript_8681/g.20654  ORF Transcript_8681/g.20654 Transcript_8681/m.20654 type:complete len:480 (-) Transcript_8681:48-1487(-)
MPATAKCVLPSLWLPAIFLNFFLSESARPDMASVAQLRLDDASDASDPCQVVQGAKKGGGRQCQCHTHLSAGCNTKDRHLSMDFYLRDVQSALDAGHDCRCVTPWESRQESREFGKYGITNTALKFCSGLYAMVDDKLPKDLAPDEVRKKLGQGLEGALRHSDAEAICQTALTGDVSAEDAEKELISNTKPIAMPIPGDETRVTEILGHQTHKSWMDLLKTVCKDECHQLLHVMRQSSYFVVDKVAKYGNSLPKECAEKVVRKVEAEVFGCCAKSCGWDGQTCRNWPFMDASEQVGWNGRCCFEDTILKGSTRERLCNSVQPPEVQRTLIEHDPAQKLPEDAENVAQDATSSLLEAALLEAAEFHKVSADCDVDKLQKCPAPDQGIYKKACKQSQMKWQFLESKFISALNNNCKCGKGEKSDLQGCLNKLGPARSVSWHEGLCYAVPSGCERAANLEAWSKPDFEPEEALTVRLFKKKS